MACVNEMGSPNSSYFDVFITILLTLKKYFMPISSSELQSLFVDKVGEIRKFTCAQTSLCFIGDCRVLDSYIIMKFRLQLQDVYLELPYQDESYVLLVIIL